MGLGEEARTKAKELGGTYQPTMGSDEYASLFRNLNPNTQNTMNTLNSLLTQYSNPSNPTFQGGQWGGRIDNMMSQGKREGDLNYFTNQVMPGMYGALQAPKEEAQGYIGDLVSEQLSAAAPQWANSSSKYSGANLDSRNRIAGQIGRQVGYDITKDMNQQAVGLGSQYLGGMNSMNQAGLGAYSSLYGADTQRYGADAGMYSSKLGFASGILNNLSGLSASERVAPDLEYIKTLKEARRENWTTNTLPTITGFGGLGSNIAGMILGSPGVASAIGDK